jgi:hypothetical protein
MSLLLMALGGLSLLMAGGMGMMAARAKNE